MLMITNVPCFRELPTPRQTNLYDCGLYVMAIARVICQWYCAAASSATANHVDARFPNIMKHVDNSLESTMRSELLVLVEQLKSHSTGLDDQPQPQPQQTSLLLCER
ncbi:NEDD8-specific protease 1-like [Prunus yedoensis var. nudiflora]|uniref:NEDD8-specific protease 1-like n=1 Tax=Prunus yedoensis var. nudiflora TaxID=2094558 RepID=A0A314Y2H1_PRUYE|nr:NEDD8-specific protease 1-like [Prunus yedoensis var. nudiflora]